jgi:hypothetical protein
MAIMPPTLFDMLIVGLTVPTLKFILMVLNYITPIKLLLTCRIILAPAVINIKYAIGFHQRALITPLMLNVQLVVGVI